MPTPTDGQGSYDDDPKAERELDGAAVAKCLEELPLGWAHWEMMLCGFLTWFLLGAVYESSPLAFFFIGEEWSLTPQRVAMMATALMAGNVFGIIAGGWLADRYGRTALTRPALICICLCALLQWGSSTFAQTLCIRFCLGISTGCLMCLTPMLLAELLPWRYRSTAAAIWGCGWPTGALFAVATASKMPFVGWRGFYAIMATPAFALYIAVRAGFLPESPRYLYLAGRHDECFGVLKTLYDKHERSFPWKPRNASLKLSGDQSVRLQPGTFPAEKSGGPFSNWSRSSITATFWIFIGVLALNSAALSLKIWMPSVLAARQLRHNAANWPYSDGFRVAVVGARRKYVAGVGLEPDAWFNGNETTNFKELTAQLATKHNLNWATLAPLKAPTQEVLWLLAEAYAVQFAGIALLALVSVHLGRGYMVKLCLLTALLATIVALTLADSGHFSMCATLVGLQLIAHACAYNYMVVFIAEHYPTCRRAQATSVLVFGAQSCNVLMPIIIGCLVVRKSAPSWGVICFGFCYLIGFCAVLWLPLQAAAEKPLQDVDEKPKLCTDIAENTSGVDLTVSLLDAEHGGYETFEAPKISNDC